MFKPPPRCKKNQVQNNGNTTPRKVEGMEAPKMMAAKNRIKSGSMLVTFRGCKVDKLPSTMNIQ